MAVVILSSTPIAHGRARLRADLQRAGSGHAHPVAAGHALRRRSGFLGNRLPDREARVEEFLLRPAAASAGAAFPAGRRRLARQAVARPTCVKLGHVGTAAHNAFNVTPRAVLNINRASMAATGFSPPTRVFEAAGAGACLITDAWDGIELFLEPGEEVLVARDGADVAEHHRRR